MKSIHEPLLLLNITYFIEKLKEIFEKNFHLSLLKAILKLIQNGLNREIKFALGKLLRTVIIIELWNFSIL